MVQRERMRVRARTGLGRAIGIVALLELFCIGGFCSCSILLALGQFFSIRARGVIESVIYEGNKSSLPCIFVLPMIRHFQRGARTTISGAPLA